MSTFDTTQPALLACASGPLNDAVRRIAAAANRGLTDVTAPLDRTRWDGGEIVLLDLAAARSAIESRFPRRGGVVVLADREASLEHWRVATLLGAAHVIVVPADEGALVAVLAPAGRSDGDGGVVVIVGGCGGAGASTFAGAVATVAARERRTLLVDGDAHGGGLDLLLGWEDEPGMRWSGLVLGSGRVSADALHHALPHRGRLALLCTSRDDPGVPTPHAAGAVVDAGRDAGDLVVCDVPRHPDSVADVLIAAADLVTVIVPAQVRAASAALTITPRLRAANANVGLVVRGPAPGGLRSSDVEEMLGLPLLASVRPERRLEDTVDRIGLQLSRRSPLAAGARAVLATFDRKPVWAS